MAEDTKYPVELVAPDIEDHRAGNTGIEFVSTFDSGQPGPHVTVCAVTHGNEICGAIAVDRLLRDGLRPVRGKLSFTFNNFKAFQSFDPQAPENSRFVDEDFNRVWTEERLDGSDKTEELRRARELRPFFHDVDLLLDLHSMGTYSKALMICNGLEKERILTRQIDYPSFITCGSGHVVGKRLIEYTPFHQPDDDKVALLVECGQHWAEYTGVVAMDTTIRFLVATGAVERDSVEQYLSEEGRNPERAQMWDVVDGITARTDDFEFVQPYVGMEIIEKAGSVIANDGGEPVTTPHDNCLLMMPNYKPGAGTRKVRLCKRVG